jgi:hypothetical protein
VPHSDLDLLVVEPSVQSPDDESVRLRRELSDVLVSMDIDGRVLAARWPLPAMSRSNCFAAEARTRVVFRRRLEIELWEVAFNLAARSCPCGACF